MSLRPLVPVLAFALLAAPGAEAHAELLNGGKIALKLKLPSESGGTSFADPTPTYLLKYFNHARCTCDLNKGTPQKYRVEYSWVDNTPPSPIPDQIIDVWSGVGCAAATDVDRPMTCTHQPPIEHPSDLSHTVQVDYHVSDLAVDPDESTCGDISAKGEHWAVTQTGAAWDPDNRFQLPDITVDMKSPTLPTTITAVALEGGIRLTWTAITSGQEDIHVFQALCSRADGTVAHANPTHTSQYETPRTLCGDTETGDITLPPITPTNPTSPTGGTLPPLLGQLNESFVCGQSDGNAGGISLEGLADNEPYWVVLLSVDSSGNVAGTYIDRPITPQAVIDFWEELNDADGNVRGGFCVAQVGGDGALGSAGLVVLAALIAVRRRRRRNPRLARIVTLALVLAPGVASAQNSFSPYWDEDDQDSEGIVEPHWNVGLRLGPYVPSIDDNFDADPGPYARTFKYRSYMFGLDVHRLWSVARGQLGIGMSGGYYTNSALAFQEHTMPSDPNRPRAEGNLTRLSILPLQLTAIYRATILDDEMGIPIVPYVRGGLGYYVWWIRAPSGDIAVAKSCPTCSDRALGASLGVVAAAGLAIRAERIDGDAARSMQDSGLEHAGFYAEIEGSWVSGFGSEKRLSVGDVTWFGGINFEF